MEDTKTSSQSIQLLLEDLPQGFQSTDDS